jgi:hypothetical protein
MASGGAGGDMQQVAGDGHIRDSGGQDIAGCATFNSCARGFG